jgi:hypothetical protein
MSSKCCEALQSYHEILERCQKVNQGVNAVKRQNQAEAVVLYKMSKVHLKQNDIEAALEKLHWALQAVHAINCDVSNPKEKEQKGLLETQIILDITKTRVQLEKQKLEWV